MLSETDLTVTEGDAAGSSYTVKLVTEPTGSVSVAITGHAGTDLTLSGTTLSSDMLTFTVDNWDDAQTVMVKAGQDNDAANDTGTLTHTASGGDYAGITADLPVTVTDDDTTDIVLSETDLTVTEGDAAGSSYTVKLATQPSGSVSVSITGHDGTDLSLDKTSLTFTVDDWATAQTVTVKAGNDDNGANDTAALTHTASGGDYAGITADLPVTVTDTDTTDIALSETGLTVTEGDATGVRYTVALATEPSGSVSVSITGYAGTDLSLSGTTLSSDMLTFTVDNWDTAQTVTIKAGQDNDGANDTATLAHTASGGDYVNVTKDLPVSITDDDAAAIVLSETGLTVTEGDAAGSSYTVRLATEPTGERVGDHLRTRRHGPDAERNHAEQRHADLHGGQLGRCADGDGQGGPGQRRRQRHRHAGAHRLGRRLRLGLEHPAGDGHRRRHGGHRAQRDGPHRDGGRRRGVELHGEAGHRADGRGHRDRLRSCGHGPDAGQDEPDLHGGQLGRCADG